MSSCKLIPCLYSSKHIETVKLKCLLQQTLKFNSQLTFAIFAAVSLACEQALRGLWWQGGKRKESLQLGLWNLNICIEKVYVKC